MECIATRHDELSFRCSASGTLRRCQVAVSGAARSGSIQSQADETSTTSVARPPTPRQIEPSVLAVRDHRHSDPRLPGV